MGRPKGTKNVMRSSEEKTGIIKEYQNGSVGLRVICEKYGISYSTLINWIKQYSNNGTEGLESQTGKKTGGTKGQGSRKPKTEEEILQREIIKLEIENARLKKGYLVKGVGVKKEYVTTQEENMK